MFIVVRTKGLSVTGILAALTVALALGCVSASAQAATGLEPGVHVDPGSPAAKQYALPLSQARQTGGGASTNSGSAVLFGAGIKPPGSGGSGPARSSAGGTQHGAHRGAAGASSSDLSTSVPAIVRASNSRASSGGDGSLLALLGGGVAILVLGGFGGTLMRRSRRSVHPV
jgi:hypothetical protein